MICLRTIAAAPAVALGLAAGCGGEDTGQDGTPATGTNAAPLTDKATPDPAETTPAPEDSSRGGGQGPGY